MRAVVVTRPGGPEVLELADRPDPEPGSGQVRVRVRASGLNRADLMQRAGRYPAPPGWPEDIPGLEYSGEIDCVGPNVHGLREGERVMGLVGGGACAEAVVVHEREAVAIPDELGFEEAAAMPEAFITAHDALFTQLALRMGERVLIHAVGSGVGTAALQLAGAAGASVIGTSRSRWKLERAAALGMELGVVPGADGFADEVLAHTDGRGVEVVLDLVGAAYLHDNLRSLAERGRMAVVGLVAGSRAELDMAAVLRRRLRITGTALRSRQLEEKIAATRAFADAVLPLVRAGRVRPVLDGTYPPEEVREAHARLEQNLGFGKVVIAWPH